MNLQESSYRERLGVYLIFTLCLTAGTMLLGVVGAPFWLNIGYAATLLLLFLYVRYWRRMRPR